MAKKKAAKKATKKVAKKKKEKINFFLSSSPNDRLLKISG